MKHLLMFLMLVILIGCASQPQTSYIEPFIDAETGSLSGSTVAGAGWELNKGVIEPLATDDMTYLYTSRKFDNFVLSLEFFPVGNVNSGIFIRCRDQQEISFDSCYEINIWDDHPDQDKRTGSIVSIELPLEKISTVDQWNQCVITADTDQITVRMNGVVTAVHEGTTHKEGFIALQRANAETVRFRNIRLESLD